MFNIIEINPSTINPIQFMDLVLDIAIMRDTGIISQEVDIVSNITGEVIIIINGMEEDYSAGDIICGILDNDSDLPFSQELEDWFYTCF